MKRIALALYVFSLLAALRALQKKPKLRPASNPKLLAGKSGSCSIASDHWENAVEEVFEPRRGRNADSPAEIPALGWRDVLYRVYQSLEQDRVMLIAAGSTFYLLLALFPALTAFVSLYGFLADRATVAGNISLLAGILPNDAIGLIRAQLEALATQDVKALGVGFLLGLMVALWSANNGFKAIFEALNVAYGEDERRSFLRLNLISFLFTFGGLFFGIVLIAVLGIIPPVLDILGLAGWSEALIRIARWPLMAIIVALAISLIYRFGPDREYAKWRWLSIGAVLSALVWIIASAGFTFYLSNFADYNATYGTLGAVVGLMMWTWISLIILILGAELNAELEHQTAVDSTTGEPLPMGQRGAVVADTLGKSIN
ncbi:YihY/virulence factor BrkB family protein [Phyllobacterium lublinensis]|uniref:YihY/virulence factor BrkB family protein n=1 Tax=Phyllobacterium lublinensis TaxID=2875708 RepID=UPI001CCA4B5C|nr:YihY/virulence factor BrkB family protein [Phyllobacterium sp. 2063]MBZ9657300.1 YihY/virulence factor BrkB family protein [Phyllobacterium sp. 2063]